MSMLFVKWFMYKWICSYYQHTVRFRSQFLHAGTILSRVSIIGGIQMFL